MAAPHFLIRSPFAYVICLQLRSLHLRRATLILKSFGGYADFVIPGFATTLRVAHYACFLLPDLNDSKQAIGANQ